jgi:hypothetical protein
MSKTNTYILFLLLIVTASGCKKFLGVNNDPSNPNDVPMSLILGPVEASISNTIAAGNASMLITSWMQQTTQNQNTPNSDVYQVNSGSFDSYWSSFYATTLINLQHLQQKAQASNNTIYDGVAKVLFAYTLGNATDLWGEVPDSKAFMGADQLKPSYDSQEQIYAHLQILLDSAVIQLTAKKGTAPAADDYFYHGDTGKWIRAAYLLKARFYMHLSKAPGHTAAAQADLAIAALALSMQSNDDDMVFPYAGTANTLNPIYQNYSTASPSTTVLSSRVVDSLVNRNDPRLSKLVTKGADGVYRGRDCGAAAGAPDVTIFSTPGSFYGSTASGCYILDYTEAVFLKAEATLVKSGYAAASDIYRTGIKAHFMKLGIDTTGATAQAYLLARGSLNANDAWEKLMGEKATASFLSIENYTDWRRTGYPALKLVQNAVTTTIPTRFLYPLTELTSNKQPQQSAKITDKLWWNQ